MQNISFFLNIYVPPGWTLWTSALTVRWMLHAMIYFLCLGGKWKYLGCNFNSYLSRLSRNKKIEKPSKGSKRGSLHTMFWLSSVKYIFDRFQFFPGSHMPYFGFSLSNMCRSSILLRLALQKDTKAEDLLRVVASNPQGNLSTPS